MECHEQLAMNGEVQDKVEMQESRQVSPEPHAEKCDETQVVETWLKILGNFSSECVRVCVCVFVCLRVLCSVSVPYENKPFALMCNPHNEDTWADGQDLTQVDESRLNCYVCV